MYSSLNNITEHIDLDLIIQLVNDENRRTEDVDVNLDDPDDLVVKRVTEAIKSADAEIDSYLISKYSVPLTAVPDIIEDISIDLAIYNLYKRRHRLDMPESLTDMRKLRVKQLEQIQKGMMQLPIQQQTSDKGSGEFRTNKSSEDKIFNKDLLDKM